MTSFAEAFVRLRVDARQLRDDTTSAIKSADTKTAGATAGKSWASGFTGAVSKEAKASASARNGILGLTGSIAGLNDVTDAASSKSSKLARVWAGVSAATGLLEPVAAELAVTIGTMAAAAGGAAIGLGAYGLVIGNVMAEMKKLKQLQTAAATGNKAAGQALQAYLKTLTPAFQAFHNQLDATKTAYQNWGKSLEAPVLAPLVRGLKLVQPLLKQISPVVKLAAASIGFLIDRLGTSITGGGFAKWLKAMTPAIMPAITGIGIAVGHIVVGLGGVLKAFAPFVPMFMDGLDKITARFAKWGQTLTSHSGFQSLIGLWTKSGPKVNEIFRNLVTILANVGKNMAGLATPSNSAALINILTPLSGIIARLSQNQGLVKFVLYFLLLKSSLGQVTGPLKAASGTISGISGAIGKGSSAFTAFRAGFVNSAAAASSATGIWGSAGGKIRDMAAAIKGWTIWSKIATAATKVWSVAVAAFNLIMDGNVIAIVVLAIVALVAVFVVLWTKCKWFRDFWKGLWHGIVDVAKAAWHWIQDAAMAVWDWLKKNWPLLLGILTGPIGLAVAFILTHWNMVTAGAKALWGLLKRGFDIVWGAIKAGVRVLATTVLNIIGTIIDGAAKLFGWLPGGIGKDLKAAAAHFDEFRRHVNGALGGINNKHVSVKVDFGASATPGPRKFAARGLYVAQGRPGTDDQLIMAQRGELVVPTSLVASGAVDHLRGRIPGFAAGGRVGISTSLPTLKSMEAAVMPPIEKLARMLFASGVFTTIMGAAIARTAQSYVGRVPYVWGGTSTSGWDCSGMVLNILSRYGFAPPRTAAEQQRWARPTRAPFAGGLAFFGGADGTAQNAGHVGIIVGPNLMANAYGTGFGTIDSSFASGGAFGGFGIPPGNRFRKGGWLHEAIAGVGLGSGQGYMFHANEAVTSERGLADLASRLDALIDAVYGAARQNAYATADGIAAAIGGAAHTAAHRAEWSPR